MQYKHPNIVKIEQDPDNSARLPVVICGSLLIAKSAYFARKFILNQSLSRTVWKRRQTFITALKTTLPHETPSCYLQLLLYKSNSIFYRITGVISSLGM